MQRYADDLRRAARELSVQSQQLTSVEEAAKETKKESSRRAAELQTLRDRVSTLSASVANVTAERNVARAEAAKLHARLARMSTQLAKSDARRETLEKELAAASLVRLELMSKLLTDENERLSALNKLRHPSAARPRPFLPDSPGTKPFTNESALSPLSVAKSPSTSMLLSLHPDLAFSDDDDEFDFKTADRTARELEERMEHRFPEADRIRPARSPIRLRRRLDVPVVELGKPAITPKAEQEGTTGSEADEQAATMPEDAITASDARPSDHAPSLRVRGGVSGVMGGEDSSMTAGVVGRAASRAEEDLSLPKPAANVKASEELDEICNGETIEASLSPEGSEKAVLSLEKDDVASGASKATGTQDKLTATQENAEKTHFRAADTVVAKSHAEEKPVEALSVTPPKAVDTAETSDIIELPQRTPSARPQDAVLSATTPSLSEQFYELDEIFSTPLGTAETNADVAGLPDDAPSAIRRVAAAFNTVVPARNPVLTPVSDSESLSNLSTVTRLPGVGQFIPTSCFEELGEESVVLGESDELHAQAHVVPNALRSGSWQGFDAGPLSLSRAPWIDTLNPVLQANDDVKSIASALRPAFAEKSQLVSSRWAEVPTPGSHRLRVHGQTPEKTHRSV